uniref:DAGKc domain-containing protein n=1 Tax=Palpitomonas bilix TaxID=652834 RepID=A0A7S3G0H4_9EUKA
MNVYACPFTFSKGKKKRVFVRFCFATSSDAAKLARMEAGKDWSRRKTLAGAASVDGVNLEKVGGKGGKGDGGSSERDPPLSAKTPTTPYVVGDTEEERSKRLDAMQADALEQATRENMSHLGRRQSHYFAQAQAQAQAQSGGGQLSMTERDGALEHALLSEGEDDAFLTEGKYGSSVRSWSRLLQYFVDMTVEWEKKLVFIINPVAGGQGKAIDLFRQCVEPLVQLLKLPYQTFVTRGPMDASDIVNKLDLTDVDAIICGGGDGVMYEAFQGFFDRRDWQEKAKSVSWGALPFGTGNGLAATVNFLETKGHSGNADALTIAFSVVKGRSGPLDLISTAQKDCGRKMSFLTITTSFIADIDIGTEKLRALGALRNMIGGLYMVARLKGYRYRIEMLMRAEDAQVFRQKEEELRGKRESGRGVGGKERRMLDRIAARRGGEGSGSAQINTDFSMMMEEIHRNERVYAGKEGKGEREKSEKKGEEKEDEEASWQAKPDMRQLEDGCEWVCMEDIIYYFVAANVSHAASDINLSPLCLPWSGWIDLSIVRSRVRSKMLKMMMDDVNKGNHLEFEEFETYKVKAFRMTPLFEEDKGLIVVDGEKAEYAPLEAAILPGVVKLIYQPGVSTEKEGVKTLHPEGSLARLMQREEGGGHMPFQ